MRSGRVWRPGGAHFRRPHEAWAAVEARAFAAAAAAGLATGGGLYLAGAREAGRLAWAATVAVMLVPLVWSVVRTLLRGDVGVDAIALVAMAGALALGEYLAGAVVALMLAGGNALEEYAGGRARRELRLLVERAPRVAHRLRGEALEEVPVEELAVGDAVLVRAGEVVPVDGLVEADEAEIDESTLTGEPLPVRYRRGELVRSGTANAGEAFRLRAVRPAAESAYAALVRLVREAEKQRAPLVRLADRYAAVFLPATLAAAGAAWALSGDPVRGLAVVVVATPCPLILAAPIALVSGVSRAARAGVVVKGGGVIERLGRVRTAVLDKTGTLTRGTPAVERVVTADGRAEDELLRLAATVDQLSVHTLAGALVTAARERRLPLAFPDGVEEDPGQGIEGTVDGRRVGVGAAAWLQGRGYRDAAGLAARADRGDGASVFVGVDGAVGGVILLGDRLRADADGLVARLRALGVGRIVMATGDDARTAERVAAPLGVDGVHADLRPEDKLAVLRRLRADPARRPVLMVGDGVNDAPALGFADVGIALASAGATVASETADAVITGDEIGRVADAVAIGRRSLAIARQSMLYGLGLSVVAMGFAAFGYLPPVYGALLQEGIDVAVIVNALRALRG